MSRIKESMESYEARFGEVLEILLGSDEPSVDRLWVIEVIKDLLQRYGKLVETLRLKEIVRMLVKYEARKRKNGLKDGSTASDGIGDTDDDDIDDMSDFDGEDDLEDDGRDERKRSGLDGDDSATERDELDEFLDGAILQRKIKQILADERASKKSAKRSPVKDLSGNQSSRMGGDESNASDIDQKQDLKQETEPPIKKKKKKKLKKKKKKGDNQEEKPRIRRQPSQKGIPKKLNQARAMEVEEFYRKHRSKGKKFIVDHFVAHWDIGKSSIYHLIRKLDSGGTAKHRKRPGRRRQDLPPELLNEMLELAKTDINLSLHQLAKRFNIHLRKVKTYLEEHGVSRRLTAKEKRMIKCAMKGEPYTPREPHYSAEEGRRRRQRNKLLELKKRGIIPWEEGDLMPDGRIKTGPKFKKGVPPEYRNVSLSSMSISSSDERSMTAVSAHGDDAQSREDLNMGINEARAAAAAAMAVNDHPNDSMSSQSANQNSSCQRMSSSASSQPSLYHHKASQLETLQSFQSVMSHQLQQQQNMYAAASHQQQAHSSHHLQVPSSSSSNSNPNSSASSASLLHSWASDYNFIWPSSTSTPSSFGARLPPHHAHQFSASSFASGHHHGHQSTHHHNQSHHLGPRNLT